MKKITILSTTLLLTFLFTFVFSPIETALAQSTGADQSAYASHLQSLYTGYDKGNGQQSPLAASAGSCIGSFVGNWIGGQVSKGLSSMFSSDSALKKLVPTDDTNQKSANYRDETLNGIAFCVGNGLITAITQSIVQWINNGFKNPDGTSGPSFLSNPSRFFRQMADREVGAFFQGLGPIGNVLCKPFDLQIRLSLLSQYNRRGNAGLCTLTSIKQNLSRFGNNGNGYLGDWFQLTQQDNNNAIGSYFIARQQLADGITYSVDQNKMEIDLGKGFLDLKTCSKYSNTVKDPNTGKYECTEWKHTTPGNLGI